jgi:hypothetical protein
LTQYDIHVDRSDFAVVSLEPLFAALDEGKIVSRVACSALVDQYADELVGRWFGLVDARHEIANLQTKRELDMVVQSSSLSVLVHGEALEVTNKN